MEKSLVLASNNKGKLREFQAMFAEFGVDVINQGALGVEACPEPFGTFIENCLAKARHASKMTGRPAMADDSGVCVNALNGMPGVLSARFAGELSNDEANNRLLVERLQGKDDRRAHYTCVLTAVPLAGRTGDRRARRMPGTHPVRKARRGRLRLRSTLFRSRVRSNGRRAHG